MKITAFNIRGDYKGMLKRGIEEIQTLRSINEKLAPRAEAYDNIVKILGLLPRSDRTGMGEDVIWLMKKRLEELSESDNESTTDDRE